ncbi:MAG: alpha/beta hydrolase [Burkholderiaceae bacterium]
MDDPSGPNQRGTPGLTGVAGLVKALRNLGLIGRGRAGARSQQSFAVGDGQSIPVHITGSGPPVVLVHGLGCSHRSWNGVVRSLARRHRVITWDARGHGQCVPLPGRAITLQRLARDVHELLDTLALERVALVGHSMGALTVMQYLLDHGSARLAAVGLVDQSPRIVTDDDWRLGLFGGCPRSLLGGVLAGAREDLAATVLHEIEAAAGGWLRPLIAPGAPIGGLLRRWLVGIDASFLLDLSESLLAADFRPVLPRLDVPLWVVLGAKSAHYAGVPLDDYYRRTVPHAQVTTYARSGHSPHVAEPQRFARDLQSFLADHA